MFTGLVQEVGEIRSLVPRGAVTSIGLVATQLAPQLRIGDSLQVRADAFDEVLVRDGLAVDQRHDAARLLARGRRPDQGNEVESEG